ncbi:MAG: AmmeMemoRadiSam system protein B [Brevinematales bacterium]|nr:AmmeMemoRadiSam system protein B [Brevinematales bacterium]
MLDDGKSCRKPNYAGSFYPSEKFKLEEIIRNYIEESDIPKEVEEKKIIAIISPHAGYKYSGIVAAHSYKAIRNKSYDVAIILAPSHHFYLHFFIVDDRKYYQTPLGPLKVNKDITEFLRNKQGFEVSYKVQDEEHSLEVQLPFLHYISDGKIEIVPILYGEENRIFMTTMTEVLDEIFEKFKDLKILIVVSTDLSHYHPYKEAYIIDNRLIEILREKDFEAYISMLNQKKIEACGAGPLGTFLYMAKTKNKEINVLKLLNSGDTSGTKDYVVGYLSAIMY